MWVDEDGNRIVSETEEEVIAFSVVPEEDSLLKIDTDSGLSDPTEIDNKSPGTIRGSANKDFCCKTSTGRLSTFCK